MLQDTEHYTDFGIIQQGGEFLLPLPPPLVASDEGRIAETRPRILYGGEAELASVCHCGAEGVVARMAAENGGCWPYPFHPMIWIKIGRRASRSRSGWRS